ncbi:D-glycero-beta-D-manno-heptose 1,7-bisphosphate 7-phosphatase [Porticoccus sp.]|uniref:D-glycero-beta-D-manno-heptose 1,7-bisphosphate 7-phosphatase n=1 Tax=Porticoccus sp. TaxID=2024853 RepID=UPI003F6A1E6D
MTKLVILDRDGVINQDSDNYIKSVDEWVPLPGSIDAIGRLYRAGYTVVVATNQSGIGRGLFDLDDLEAMHAKLSDLLIEQGAELGGIFYCPHTPEDHCHCRKPAPGLIDAIANEFGISLNRVPLIGDSLRDLQAGLSNHCVPILVRTGKGATTEKKLPSQPEIELQQAAVFDDLDQAVDHILAHPGHRNSP